MWSKPKPQEADPIYYKSGFDSSGGSGVGGYGYPAQIGNAQCSDYGRLANSCGGNEVWMNGRKASVPYHHPANQAAVWNNGTREALPRQSSTNHLEVWNNGAGVSMPSLNSSNSPGFMNNASVPYGYPANKAAVWNKEKREALPLQSSTNHPEVWNNGAGASVSSLNSTSANPPGFTNNGRGSPYPSTGSQQEGRVVSSQGFTRPNYPSCSMDKPGRVVSTQGFSRLNYPSCSMDNPDPKSSFPASTQMCSSRYPNYPSVDSFFPNSSPSYSDVSPSYRSSTGSTPSYPSSGSNCPSTSPSFPTSGQRLDSFDCGTQQGYHSPSCNIFNQAGSNPPNRFHGMDWNTSRYARPDNFYNMDFGSWSSSGATSGDEQAASNWSGSHPSDQNYSKDWHASGFSGPNPTFGRGYQHCNNPHVDGNNLQPTTDSDEEQEAEIPQQAGAIPKKKQRRLALVPLIGGAILSDPGERASLAQICQYIRERNEEYCSDVTRNWKNNVRHTLSHYDFFIKSHPIPNERGFYWTIHPVCLQKFRAGDFRILQARREMEEFKKKRSETMAAKMEDQAPNEMN